MQSCTRPSTLHILRHSPQPHRRHFFKLPQVLPSNPFAPTPSNSTAGSSKLRREGSAYIYEEGRVMPYTPQELYQVIADVDSYSSFVPYATSSRVLSSSFVTRSEKGKGKQVDVREKGWLSGATEGKGTGEGEGDKWTLEAELKVGAMGFEEGYVSKVECTKWSTVTATAQNSPLFKKLITRWSFSPLPPTPQPQTQVDLHIAYAFSSPFHAAAAGAVWEKVSTRMVGEFEKRIREVYGR